MNRRNLLRLALALPIAGIAAAQQMTDVGAHVDPRDPMFAHVGVPFCLDCDPFGLVTGEQRSPWHISRAFLSQDPIAHYTTVMLGDRQLCYVFAVEISKPSWIVTGTTAGGEMGISQIDDCPTCPGGVRAELRIAPVWLDIAPDYWEQFAEYERFIGRGRQSLVALQGAHA